MQLTAPAPDLKLANRELGTVEGIGQDGRMSLKMDGGRPGDRLVELDSVKNPHLDHGYAVTSHSSQGQTADRVLIHVDSGLGAKDLLKNRWMRACDNIFGTSPHSRNARDKGGTCDVPMGCACR